MAIMYGRVFKRLQAKSKAKGKSSELKTGMESTGATPVTLTPTRTNTNDHHPPDESRSRWDEYESKSADMALFKLHTNATHHPIEPYERSISHDSIFAMATTPPWGNTSLGLGAASATSGQDNDSVDLTIFIDDDQSCATELFPIYRVRPSLVTGRSPEQEEKVDNNDGDHTTAPQPNDGSRPRGCRSSLRRSHSGGLDPYLLPPPRFTRFEI